MANASATAYAFALRKCDRFCDQESISDLAPVLLARRGLKSTANSLSPLKWTIDRIPVHLSGLLLLAREFILWRVSGLLRDLSYLIFEIFKGRSDRNTVQISPEKKPDFSPRPHLLKHALKYLSQASFLSY